MKRAFIVMFTITLIFAVPISTLFIVSNSIFQNYYEKKEEESISTLLAMYNFETNQIVANIKQNLTILSQDPTITGGNKSDCNETLSKFVSQNPQYANAALFLPDGTPYCGAVISDVPTFTETGDPYFENAIKTRTYTVGDYRIGRLSFKPLVPFGYPVYKSNGNLVGVLTIGLDINWLGNYYQSFPTIPGISIALLDQNGAILKAVQSIDFVIPSDVTKEILAYGTPGIVPDEISDTQSGRDFLYIKLTDLENNPLSIVISYEKSQTQPVFTDFIQSNFIAVIIAIIALMAIITPFVPKTIKKLNKYVNPN